MRQSDPNRARAIETQTNLAPAMPTTESERPESRPSD